MKIWTLLFFISDSALSAPDIMMTFAPFLVPNPLHIPISVFQLTRLLLYQPLYTSFLLPFPSRGHNQGD